MGGHVARLWASNKGGGEWSFGGAGGLHFLENLNIVVKGP
jgi:hypothetical protein